MNNEVITLIKEHKSKKWQYDILSGIYQYLESINVNITFTTFELWVSTGYDEDCEFQEVQGLRLFNLKGEIKTPIDIEYEVRNFCDRNPVSDVSSGNYILSVKEVEDTARIYMDKIISLMG